MSKSRERKATRSTDYVTRAHKYARDVVAGKIPACKWTIRACERHLADLARKNWRYKFDAEKAAQACRRVENFPHIKGEWARRGELIHLEGWQLFIVCSIFGWVDKKTGLRRFRTVYIEVPRKNAKSTLAAAIGLVMLGLDDEAGAEVYSAATTRDQARIVFSDAQAMVRKSQPYREKTGAQVGAHNIHILSQACKFEALSRESSGLDGLNIHCGIIDELHAHKTREIYDVIETATGARQQPLILAVTTAGSNRSGICYEIRGYLLKLLDGVAEDDTFFGVVYTIDDGDDWTDPKVWAKANPNYGVSVYPDDIARLAKKALEMPSARNNFLTKRLNVWVNADTAWMDMRKWEACGNADLVPEDFEGEECVIGYDLASKVDLAARIQLFEKSRDDGVHYYAFGKYYLPEEAAENGTNSQYSGWAEDGRLILTPGNVIDYAYIEDDLKDAGSRFQVREVPYDPFQATQFSTRMAAEGFTMVELRPTVLNFSEPMKELEKLVLSGRFHHDGDPVLTWMVSNVVCHTDAKDNIYPRKERPENKIDGVVALIMALNRALAKKQDGPSVYDERGIIWL